MWASGAPTQVVIPWDGWWTLAANAGFDNNSASYRIAAIAVNGARVAEDLKAAVNGAPTQLACSTSMWLAAGTIVTLLVWQTSGFAINATPSEVPISLSVVAA